MATKERVGHTLDNFIWGYINIGVTSIMPFFVRSLIIRKWGMEYLGINSLFASILNVLNISELGIGSAIIYNLYRPVAEKNIEETKKLLALYNLVYKFLGLVILGIGLCLVPFLSHLINGEIPDGINIYIIYFIYLINTIVSYWIFPYSIAVFQANQITSVNNKICAVVWLFNYTVQLLVVICSKNYYLYFLLLPIGSLAVYIFTGVKQRRAFPQYVPCKFKKDFFTSNFWKEFKKRVVGMSISKFRTTCRGALDTIVISAVLGLSMTAKYQNYLMVMTVPAMLILYITGAALPSLGNSVAIDSNENSLGITKMVCFVVEWVSVFFGALLMCFYQPFMYLYAGEAGMLSIQTAVLFVVFFYLKSISSISDMVRNSCGVWWEGRWIAVCETICNLLLNIVLVYIIGVNGIILATIVSLFFINIPLETCCIYKYYFKKSACGTLLGYCKSFIVAFGAIGITYGISVFFEHYGFVGLLLDLAVCLIIPNVIFGAVYFKSEEMTEMKQILKNVWKNDIKEKKNMKSTSFVKKSEKSIMRKVASMFEKIILGLLWLPWKYGQIKNCDDFVCNLMIPITQAIEKKSNCYVTYNLYPKYANNLNEWRYGHGIHASDTAIIMQGPLRKEEDFTLETVRYYQKVYPEVKVIVSTWKTEDMAYIKRLENEINCEVVLSDAPENAGVANINYQTKSSLAGVREAKRLNCQYVLKTRTDSRVTMPGILEHLVQLVNEYPIYDRQMGRIILFNAYLFLPFMEFGTYYFGKIQDMENLFDCKLHSGKVEKGYADKLLENGVTYKQLYKEGCALNWVMKCYAERIENKVKCDLNDWWNFLSKYTICLPVAYLHPLWVKYDYNHEESDMIWMYRRKILGSTGVDNTMVDYATWNALKNKQFPDSEQYGNLINLPMR